MAISNWEFTIAPTENANIQVLLTSTSPYVGTGSLRIRDLGTAVTAGVAVHLPASGTQSGLSRGKIRTILQKQTGNGYRDHGMYFLATSNNPWRLHTKGYAVRFPDGGTSFEVIKFTNGLSDSSQFEVLETFTNDISHPVLNITAPIVCEVAWTGGRTAEEAGSISLTIRYKQNSVNFGEMITLTPTIVDGNLPVYYGQGEGLYTRSTDASEPLYGLFDQTRISTYPLSW